MKKAIWAVLGFTMLTASCAPQTVPRIAEWDKPRAETQNLRDYGLVACIHHAAKGQPLARDAEISSAGLIARGHAEAQAYVDISAAAKTFLRQVYTGSVEGRYDVQKCIDFYHSPELKALVDQYTVQRPMPY